MLIGELLSEILVLALLQRKEERGKRERRGGVIENSSVCCAQRRLGTEEEEEEEEQKTDACWKKKGKKKRKKGEVGARCSCLPLVRRPTKDTVVAQQAPRTLHAAIVSLFCFIVHCDVSKYALRSPSVCVEKTFVGCCRVEGWGVGAGGSLALGFRRGSLPVRFQSLFCSTSK